MFRKSFIIVIIQLLGIILGFISIYFVAGEMAPETYSLVGVYAIINGFTVVFTNLGVETTMMREALYWKELGDTERIVEYTTQSILSRLFGFILVTPFLLGFLIYLDFTKYNNQNLVLFVCFYIGAFINSLSDSISLTIRSQGDYVYAQFARTLNTDIMKFVAIIIFIYLGEVVYLYFYALYSVPLLIIFIIKIRKSISFKYFKTYSTIEKIKNAKYLFIRNYLDYFKNYCDSILVSLLFPSSIMGSYTVFKNLENMIRNFEDGFFDILSQNTVKHKTNYILLCQDERRYNYARVIVAVIIVLGILIYSSDTAFFVNLVNLSQYDYIVPLIYCTLFIALFYLLGKYELTCIALHGSSKFNFKLGIYACIITVVSFAWLLLFPSMMGLLYQRLSVYLLISLISIFFFRKSRRELYTKVLS